MKNPIFIALFASLIFVGAPQKAEASFGCEVLLCLAASGGTPTECKAPLKKLFERLAKGKSFPACKMESGPDVGGGESNASLPTTERGMAVFVPRHQVCDKWGSETVSRDIERNICLKPRLVEEQMDHSGRSCASWFPSAARAVGRDANDHPNRPLYDQCRRGSKRFVRVQGGGVDGEYHYY